MSLPKTRDEARSVGCKFFFTGEDCGKGHIARSYTSTGGCVECTFDYHLKYQKEKDWYKPTATKRSRKYKVEKQYGLTVEQYRRMMDEAVECPICHTTLTSGANVTMTRAVMDHCHETKTAREVVCSRCNLLLGSSGDDPTVLHAAAAYIEKHNGRIHHRGPPGFDPNLGTNACAPQHLP